LLVAASEVTPGVMDVAVPVGVAGSDTDAVIALSFIVPARGGDKICREYTNVMRGCAAHINQNLGVASKL
jgi:DNA-binding IclR family transcriptional regulator